MSDFAANINNLPHQELENNLTRLAAHINATTCRFLMLSVPLFTKGNFTDVRLMV